MGKSLVFFLILSAPIRLFSAVSVLKAFRTDAAPVIDGRLTDPVWFRAPAESGLSQVFPVPGDPSEKTAVQIACDLTHLYLAIICFDREPYRIAGHSMAHDGYEEEGGDDLIKVLLDPRHDQRNAYLFIVNAKGAKSEGLAFGEGADLSWDGLWEAASQVRRDGWSCEIVIPFRTLALKPDAAAWGINIERYIPRKQETIRLSGTGPDDLFNNAEEAASLQGLEGIHTGAGLTIKPYVGAAGYKNLSSPALNKGRLEGGYDIYKSFAPNVIGAFSLNTDFAETEVDERRINLTRFPLLFPEKRMFFLEGSEIFNFGPNVAGQDEDAEFIPFFSRRIGLTQGQAVPMIFGAKAYGTIGRTSLALLDVMTDAVAAEGLRRQNYFAGRVTRRVLTDGRVGVLVTTGSPTGARNTLAGFDLSYQTSRLGGDQNLLVSGWYVHNWNQLRTGNHGGYGVALEFPNDLWNGYASYACYGDALNPALGFLRRNGVRNAFAGLSYQPRPRRGLIGRAVRQLFFQMRFDGFWDLTGRPSSRSLFASPLSLTTESGEYLEISVTRDYDVLPDDFGVTDLVTVPRGAYDFTSIRVDVKSAPHRPVVLDFGHRFGEYYSGRLEETDAGLLLRYRGFVTLGGRISLVRGRLPQGNFRTNLYEVQADVFVSPELGLMNYLQYDDVSKRLGFNVRFRWEIFLGNVIYIVYTKDWDRVWDPHSRFAPREENGMIKIQMCLGF